jgi:hypothetical protein
MTKTISVLAKEFIDGFRKKVDLSKLDTIEVYDSQKYDVSSDSLTGVYGWGEDEKENDIYGHSIEWKKDTHSITDVMEEIKIQLQNEYNGKTEPIVDGILLALKRIKYE